MIEGAARRVYSLANSLSQRREKSADREQKGADTIGTVLVPWAGHLQC